MNFPKKNSKRKREPVKVVEFCEPGSSSSASSSGKKRKKASMEDFSSFMAGKFKKIKGAVYKGKTVEEREEIEDRKTRQRLWKTIDKLGASQLKGKEKWEWEQENVRRRGGQVAKNRKTPIRILQGIRKKAKWREEKRNAEIRASGEVVAKKRIVSKKKKKKSDQSFEHHYSQNGGHFGSGVLKFRSDPTRRR
eukprot:g3424.t1